jgi:tetratricopeptide (TPR) repeat protein
MSATLARRYFVRAHAELARGEHEAAAESYRAAMDLVPAFLSARIGYAAALVKLGDMPRAAGVLRAGLARATAPRARATLLAHLGDVLVAGGDFFGAEDAYRQVGEIVPGSPVPAAGLARVHAKLGRHAESFAALLVAARSNPPEGRATQRPGGGG